MIKTIGIYGAYLRTNAPGNGAGEIGSGKLLRAANGHGNRGW